MQMHCRMYLVDMPLCYNDKSPSLHIHSEGLSFHYMCEVTSSLIVFSSKSDSFIERHLPGRLFVPSPTIHHLTSYHLRDFQVEPSSMRGNITIRHPLSNPLIYGTFRTFRNLSIGCITRRQDIEKASYHDG